MIGLQSDLEQADGLPPKQRRWAMVSIWLVIVMAALDTTIVNVALPAIAGDLHVSAASSVWVVNAYQIAITILIFPIAGLSERFDASRAYKLGVVIFTLASLLCAIAANLDMLVLARFLQGLGAGAIHALNGVLLNRIIPRKMLSQAIGYNVLVVSISFAAGPAVAAFVLSVASWPFLFAVNVPLGLIALAIAHRYLPEFPTAARTIDRLSITLNILFFVALFFVGADVADNLQGPRTLLLLMAGLVSGYGLFRVSRQQSAPLVPFDLIAIPALRNAYAVSVLSWMTQTIAFVGLPFFLMGTLKLDHASLGLMIMPWPLAVGAAGPFVGHLASRDSASRLSGFGLAMLAASLAVLAVSVSFTPLWATVTLIALAGLGFSLFQVPNNKVLLKIPPHDRAGAASGMLAVSRLVGQTCGGVLVALLLRVNGSSSPLVLLCAAGLGCAASCLCFIRPSPE